MKTNFIFSLLVFFIASPSIGGEIIIKQGDTISTIAEENNISIRELMDLNQIFDADKLSVGQILLVPGKNQEKIEESNFMHKVSKSESLGSIASLYKVDKESIIILNKIKDPNYIYTGQVLRMPYNATMPKKETKLGKKTVHTIHKGETLLSISRSYGVPIEEIISDNNIKNPNVLLPGKEIFLYSNSQKKLKTLEDESKSLIWKNFGPLKVNWSNWKAMQDSYVTPAINKSGKPLFLAVNCSSSKLNSTGKNGEWKQWFLPVKDFEFNLLDDLCEEKKTSFN